MTIVDERRLVTLLFADLVGFTGRAELSDPEAVREMQRAYFAAVSAEVDRYGGTVEKYMNSPQTAPSDNSRSYRIGITSCGRGLTPMDGRASIGRWRTR